MKKKTVSFFLLGLLAVIVVSVPAALYFIDWNQYRSTLTALVSERLGVRVELAGDLSLKLLPRPTLSAQSVRLSPQQTQFNDTIATAERIDMRLGLSAALSGNIALQSLSLEGVSIALAETDAGWRIQGWPVSDDNQGNFEQENSLASLDRFQVKSGTVTANRLDGSSVKFEGLDLTLSGTLPLGPVDWQGSGFVGGTSVVVSGQIVPVKTRDETSIRTRIEAAGAAIEFSGRVSPGGNLAGRLTAEGQNMHDFAQFAAKLTNVDLPARLPLSSFDIDVQIDRKGDVSRLVSRQFSIGKTRGVVDLTVAEMGDFFNVTGAATFGVVHADDFAFGADDTVQGNAQLPSENIGLNGTIDLTIEGIEYQGGLIQQVAAVVGFENSTPKVSQLSALLPGASRLFYVAKSEQNTGSISFKSGRLPEIFKWVDIPLSDAVPSGRLSTADLSGVLRVDDSGWVLSGLSGSVDTSKIIGALSGTVFPFVVHTVGIEIDQLNLDAYWPDPQLSLSDNSESSPFPDMTVSLSVGALQWLHTPFQALKMQGAIKSGGVAISDFEVKQGTGSLKGNARLVKGEDTEDDLEVSIRFDAWAYPIIRYAAPDAGDMIKRFAGESPVSGSIALSGPYNGLQSQILMTAGAQKIEAAGTLDISNALRAQMQGTFVHTDVARLAPDLFDQAYGRTLAAASLNVSLDGGKDDLTFRTSGQLAGGQLDVTGKAIADTINADLSWNIPPAPNGAYRALMGPYAVLFNPAQASRVRAQIVYAEDEISASNIDIRSGDTGISGSVKVNNNKLSGGVSVNNLNIERLYDLDLASGHEEQQVAGSLTLNLNNVTMMGQRLVAPNALVNIAGASGSLLLGAGALLNDQPVTGDISIGQGDAKTSLKLQSATLDLGRFLQATSFAKGISGLISTDINIVTSGATKSELIAGLAGDVTFSGGAGSLYFMAVPELITAISDSNSKTNFLTSIGSLLRSGTTSFANLNGTLRFDGGVALVDEIVAAGEWGNLRVEGQANLADDLLNMTGLLSLARPQDTPPIPVIYEGSLSSPNTRWASGAIEQFALAGIQRRLSTKLFGDFEKTQAENGGTPQASPGSAVVGAAFDLLTRLRQSQAEKKKNELEGQQSPDAKADDVPNSGEQRP